MKQWQRVNLTYNFIRVPIDVLKLLLWVFIFLELSDIIPLTLEVMLVLGSVSGAVLLVLGYLLDKKQIFYKYQGQVDKIQTAERDVHRWRIAGAFVARAVLIGLGKPTDRVDTLIEREKTWFFPLGLPDGIGEEIMLDEE